MRIGLILLIVALTWVSAFADERVVIGGDAFVSGGNATLTEPSPRDAFLSGFSADIMGKVEKDASVVGFNVDFDAPVGGDIHAAGFSVKIAQPVGEDLSVAGCNIYLRNQASVGGNARLAGCAIVLDGPIAGSVIAAAGSITINQAIAGDARLTAGKITFGPDAKIGGTLTYFAPAPVEIPASVAAADRVRYEKLETQNAVGTVRDAMGESLPRFWPKFFWVFSGFVLVIVFLSIFAAVLFAFAPKLVENLREVAAAAPFKSIALGFLGMAMLVGLVPVSAITIVGIPLIPFVILAILVLWTIGYLLGAYVTSVRVADAFGRSPTAPWMRLLTLTAGLAVIASLNFVPILGWLINMLVLFLGLGAIVTRTVHVLANRT